MSPVIIRHTTVFGRGPGGGNPCPVVADAAALTGAQMQAIAGHFGHECGFALIDPDGGLRLRFFLPRHEMSMCVHATIAIVTVLRASGVDPRVVRTDSGEVRVSWRGDNVRVEQQPPWSGVPLNITAELAAATRLPLGAFAPELPVRAVSVSRPKLIVALRAAETLQAVTPDLDALWALCRAHDTTGAYLFAPHPDGRREHLVARQFPVDAGYPEDPATGVAAGALAAYLAEGRRSSSPGWCEIEIDQGDAMGRPSRLIAAAYRDANAVSRSVVTGAAELGATEELDLNRYGVE